MSVTPGINKYEVVLANQYYLRELVESISLDESLSDIAYHGQIQIVVTSDLQAIGILNGQEIRISGVPFGGTGMVYLLHSGVVWDCSSQNSGQKQIDVDIYDRTIYLAKSEDEYLFAAGTTATQRLQQYCKDWGIPVASLADTGVTLVNARSGDSDGIEMADIYFDTRDTINDIGGIDRLWVTWFYKNRPQDEPERVQTKLVVFKYYFVVHFLYGYTTKGVEDYVLSEIRKYEAIPD